MKKFLLLLMILMPLQTAKAETVARIAAVVNDRIITEQEFRDRLLLIMASSGMAPSNEVAQRLGPQVLRTLIEEELRNQEAARQSITVPEAELKAGFAQIAQQNNMTAEQFQNELARAGVSQESLNRQIYTQIAWSKLVKMRLAPKLQVTAQEADAFVNRLRNSIGKPQYLLAEIVLPTENEAQEKEAIQFSQKLIDDLHHGARFSAIARQFSQSATARNGGDLGWISAGELPKELDETLPSLSAGQVTPPIRSARGYTILMLREKRDVSEENLPTQEEALNIIGNQKLDVAQRKLMRDIRSDAVIDVRL